MKHIAVVLSALAFCGGIAHAQQAAPIAGQITGSQLHELLSGHAFEGATRVGGKVRLTYSANGDVRGDPIEQPLNGQIVTDFGKWTMEGKLACVTMTKWVEGQKECFSLLQLSDGTYERVLNFGQKPPAMRRVN
jgi:hypothetical protein